MHIQTAQGRAIHVKDMGSGPAVMLIHGWPQSGDRWEYQPLALLEAK
ncbi:alpha/beta fold hydrolase [Sphingobium mellinum]